MKKAIYLLLVSMLFVTACTEQAPRIAKYTDLYAVKGTDSLFLDRYTAVSVEQDDARPCLVFVFGGGFIAGERDAERYLPFFHYMVNQGYDVVSIDYRLGLKQVVASGDLSPENMMLGMTRTISMAVEDLYDATAFIVDKADEWGIDSSQIVSSSSGQISCTISNDERAFLLESSIKVSRRLILGDFRSDSGRTPWEVWIFNSPNKLMKTSWLLLIFSGEIAMLRLSAIRLSLYAASNT